MRNDPVLIAYAVKRRKNGWSRIGVAYPHKHGSGLTVVLKALPTTGRIVLLERDHDDDDWIQAEAERYAQT